MHSLGAHLLPDADVWRFSLWAPRARSVTLVVADRSTPDRSVLERPAELVDEVWRCEVAAADLGTADLYGYRVDGPWAPLAGDRFDRSKVLLDPYATRVWFPPGADRDLARLHRVDTIGRAPWGVLEARPTVGDTSQRPRLLADQLVIHETHVRSFTRSPSSGVAPQRRGTFAGLIDRLDHLANLGVTAIELLPVHQNDPGEGSWWGYMPLAYLAVEYRYATGDDPAAELAALAAACHARGMELLLDVVFNHTTEEDHMGPTYSLRGLDSRAYYVMSDVGEYADDAGCGNILRAAHPAAADLVLAGLERMADLGVDGFRFDLATVLGRDEHGHLQAESPTIDRITEMAQRRGLRLIAEPWDVNAYQVGDGFPGRTWMQWNGRFRDDIRSFVKGDPGMVPALVQRVQGSPDLYPDTPTRSINFVTAHDGFTLRDLVSYHHKRNEANGQGNTDGTDDNRSWNCGWEGDDGVPDDVVALRRRQMRNLVTLLLVSGGVPMLLAGDDIANTQFGNNNAYRLDDKTSWIDWSGLHEYADLHRFVGLLVSFRRSHPSIGRSSHWGQDVSFFGPEGVDWLAPDSRSLGWHLMGVSRGDDDVVVLANASWESVEMPLPSGAWRRVVDTALPSPDDIRGFGDEVAITTDTYWVAPRSTVVLVSGDLPSGQM
jgi:glycogen operon protein